MACTVNTPSITLATSGGVLSANANISAPAATVAPNPLSIASDGLFVDGSDGWIGLPSALAYSSTTSSGDAACFVLTSSVDLRAYLSPGMKIMLFHGGVTKFFIVVAVAAGTITLWAGSAYTLAAGAITVPFFSPADMPAGFPDLPTTLPPAVAYEGMTVTMIADSTNGDEWTIKFRNAEATYKWRVIGGPPMEAEVATSQAITGAGPTGYVALATAGPSIVLPRAGVYDVDLGCTHTNGLDAATGYMSYDIGGTGAVDADAVRGASSVASVMRRQLKTFATAVTLTSKYRSDGGQANGPTFSLRWISVLPVKII